MRVKYVIFFIVIVIYYSLNQPYSFPFQGIDGSWVESLALCIDNNKTFGTEFIYTYGPLGYLNTGLLPKSIHLLVPIFFHFFYLLNYLFLINYALDKYPTYFLRILGIILLILLPYGGVGDTPFNLTFFLIFWLLRCNEKPSALPLFFSIALVFLLFFIKLNLAFVGYFLFLASIFYWLLKKKISFSMALFSSSFLFFITYIGGLLFNVSILNYISSGLEIVKSYSDAMSGSTLAKNQAVVLFFLEFLLVLGYVFLLRSWSFLAKNLYLFFLIFILEFIAFKQTHNALVFINSFGFVAIQPLIASFIVLFSTQNKGSRKINLSFFFVWIIIFQLITTNYIRFNDSGKTLKGFFKAYLYLPGLPGSDKSYSELLRRKLPFTYWKKIFEYNYDNNFVNHTQKLPDNFLQKIGNQGTDFVPYETSYIYFNKLTYENRPIIQSYQVTNSWLQEKNGEKYKSVSRPSFVLGNILGFRSQNPFWTDKSVYQQLIYNYSIVDKTPKDNLFLFKANSVIKKISEIPKKSFRATLGEEIRIDSSQNLVYLKAKINYTFLGTIFKFTFQPPQLWATVTYDTGALESFRLPPPILDAGILCTYKVTTQKEFEQLATTKRTNTKIVSIKFWTKPKKYGFKDVFEGQFYELIP